MYILSVLNGKYNKKFFYVMKENFRAKTQIPWYEALKRAREKLAR